MFWAREVYLCKLRTTAVRPAHSLVSCSPVNSFFRACPLWRIPSSHSTSRGAAPALDIYSLRYASLPSPININTSTERGKCKVRYCAKFVSEVKINDSPVNKDWVEFPVGARIDLLANVAEVSERRVQSGRSWLRHYCCDILQRFRWIGFLRAWYFARRDFIPQGLVTYSSSATR